jgi:hypothetical protein
MNNLLLWAARLVAALILLQTLYFKFGGQPESIYIFTLVGIEPWGRYASGVAELISALLLLWPRTSWVGSALGAGVMAGAIGSHLTILGIEVQGDGGYLFFLALTVTACCLFILYQTRTDWQHWLAGLRRSH